MKGLKAMLDIKGYIMSNHPSFITPLKINTLELLEVNAQSSELHERIENAGVLLHVVEYIEEGLIDYKKSFGKCSNKLKAVLDIDRLLYASWYALIHLKYGLLKQT